MNPDTCTNNIRCIFSGNFINQACYCCMLLEGYEQYCKDSTPCNYYMFEGSFYVAKTGAQ